MNRGTGVRRKFGSLLCCVTVFVLFGCSGQDDPRSGPTDEATGRVIEDGMPAADVCDASLSPSAQESLVALAGDDVFTDRIDTRPPADLDEFVQRVMGPEAFSERFCQIYTATHWDNPLLAIEFLWFDEAPTPDASAPSDQRPYAAGEVAYYGDGGGVIAFPCSARGAATEEYLSAALSLSALVVAPDEDQLMDILNSVSRAVADGLGCLAESGLPEGAPERVAG
ncbi:hypothetical protein [Streptomyces hainanensis]|uniref:Uncharacterized protein n=1 Tax=Streptomyces hainanensis TaxID=402648 RepID=A0A4R4T1W6_9ACTN|nr:hypothetical protein [Streptomyces hainanensis]TDC70750.1 hypothetical protein E1283_24365 [Streptomyces hainanensis]